MNDLSQEYKELVLLTKEYLLQNEKQENASPEWIVSELETYNYFKTYAIQNKQQGAAPKNQPKKEEPLLKPTYSSSPQQAPKTVVKTEHPIENQEVTIKPPVQTEAPAAKPETETTRSFELEPIKVAASQDLGDIRKIIQNICPRQIILDEISLVLPQVMIISDHEDSKVLALLNNFSKAIDIQLAPSKIMSYKKFQATSSFSDLKMIIQTTDTKDLRRDGVSYLKVLDFAKFLSNPGLKKELWEMTKNAFING